MKDINTQSTASGMDGDSTLRLLNGLRVIMMTHVVILDAGRISRNDPCWHSPGRCAARVDGEDSRPMASLQIVLAVALRIREGCPRWVPVASGALLAAEVIEFSAGHFHYMMLHVPLAAAIFGGALRQLTWASRWKRRPPVSLV